MMKKGAIVNSFLGSEVRQHISISASIFTTYKKPVKSCQVKIEVCGAGSAEKLESLLKIVKKGAKASFFLGSEIRQRTATSALRFFITIFVISVLKNLN